MYTTEFLQLRPTVMLNSINCNLGCLYCPNKNKMGRLTTMNDEVLEFVIKKFVESYPKFISFCWHGGEPLLAGVEPFEKIVKLQKKYCAPSGIIENRIQTNATLIDEGISHFFKEHDFKVGISVDGPAWLNDLHRVDRRGRSIYEKIMRGIYFLRKNGVQFSVIIVITNQTIPYAEEIYNFIIKENFQTISLNSCFGASKFSVNPISYAGFMNRIFDMWFEEDREDISISLFENILRWFLGGKPIVCHMRNSCYRHVKVDYNGNVLPCDDFLGSNFKFGNLTKQEVDEIIRGKQYKNFFRAVTKQLPKCKSCKWLDLCNGGCSRYSFSGHLEKHSNKMCKSRKIIFEHIANAL